MYPENVECIRQLVGVAIADVDFFENLEVSKETLFCKIVSVGRTIQGAREGPGPKAFILQK